MGEACEMQGGKKTAHRNLLRKTEGDRRVGRRRCRWEDNIKMVFTGLVMK
jgi:hypothetical protein